MPYPTQKEYDPDIPEPEPLPEKHWDEVELRAWLEKRRWRAIKDAEWHERHQNIGRHVLMTRLLCCIELAQFLKATSDTLLASLASMFVRVHKLAAAAASEHILFLLLQIQCTECD